MQCVSKKRFNNIYINQVPVQPTTIIHNMNNENLYKHNLIILGISCSIKYRKYLR